MIVVQNELFYEKTSPFDGVAKIQSIKGNALAWNQKAPLLSSGYGAVRATASYADGVCTFTVTSANTICGIYLPSNQLNAVVGHDYLFMATVKPSITRTFRLGFDWTSTADELPVTANVDNQLAIIQTATSSAALILYLRSNAIGDTCEVKNVMIIDLTLLGIDSFDEFKALFPLDYYAYNAGALLALNATGIRTKNDEKDTTTALPIADYFPSGMKSAGTVYDELTPKKAYTRVGTRAYQAGDENDPTVITDKTNTYYPLVTPSEVNVNLDLSYPIYRNGTEQVLPVNTSAPSTAPLLADINYIAESESVVPYRTFWLKNANDEEWDLTNKEFKCFLNSPTGLGFKKTVNVTRYGERAVKDSEVYEFPTPQGELLFYDSANQTRYDRYNEFMKFLNKQPITLYYQLPVSALSGIPDTYSLDCEVTEVQKSESSTESVLRSSVVFDGLSFWKGEEVIIEGTGGTYTIENDSDFPIGFEITVEGTLENPYFTLEQDGEVYGEAKFVDDTATPFDSLYVNSKDGEQDLILEQSGAVLPNPLSYQDLSISNGSIYVTFVKLAKGESTLAIGMDSGSITSVDIRFNPMYRSV